MQGLSAEHPRVGVKKCGMCTASDTSSYCFPSKPQLTAYHECKSLKRLAITCCHE